MNSLSRLVANYKNLSWQRFSIITVGLTLSAQMVFALVLLVVLQALTEDSNGIHEAQGNMRVTDEFDPLKYFFLSVLMAPPIETLIFHSYLLRFLRRYVRSTTQLVSISAFLFAGFHFRTSVMSGLQALISGCFFAFAFLVWFDRKNEFWFAVRVTSLCHMLHNTVYLGLHYVPASLIFGFL